MPHLQADVLLLAPLQPVFPHHGMQAYSFGDLKMFIGNQIFTYALIERILKIR